MNKVACPALNESRSGPVRIGVIGGGSIARAHLNAYNQLPELAEVTALCDVDPRAAESRRVEFSLDADLVTDLSELCGRGDVDAVDICLPIRVHLDAILAAAKTRKHVLVEKPMTLNLDEAKTAVRAARESGITLMVAHDQRFRPRHMIMKDLIPRLGKIVCARADINQDAQSIFPPGHWHLEHRGSLLAIGVHVLDLLRYLLGDVKQVSCFERNRLVRMRGNDVAVAILEFDCGAVGTLMCTWASKGSPWHDSIILQGSLGACHTIGGLFIKEGDAPFARVEVEDDTKGEWRFRSSYREEIRHFLECLRDGKTPMTCGEDNLKTMAAIEAMFLSSREDRAIRIADMLG